MRIRTVLAFVIIAFVIGCDESAFAPRPGASAARSPQAPSGAASANAALARFPAGCPDPESGSSVHASAGMVVTDAALATQVGVDVLASGGNAVDAAVATAFALAVVYPAAGNIGGGGFLVAHVGGQNVALDFRETAPAK